MEAAQAGGAVAGAGAADGDEAEALDGAGDEFAIEAAADENGDAEVAEAPDAGKQTTMPEGVDTREGRFVAGGNSGVADIAITEGDAEAADGHARDTGDNGEGDALLQSVGGGHRLSLPAARRGRMHRKTDVENLYVAFVVAMVCLMVFCERSSLMRCLNRLILFFLFASLLSGVMGFAQAQGSPTASGDEDELRRTVSDLVERVSVLEKELREERAETAALAAASPTTAAAASGEGKQPAAAVNLRNDVESASSSTAIVAPTAATSAVTAGTTAATSPQAAGAAGTPVLSALPTQLPGGATLNYAFDGYYEYDFNQPIGRVEYLRAYDVLSNAFSINQADVIFALDPDVSAGRRYGVRLDLQFGQATATLQGNPANEARPDIYRNIFQAYGTYVIPLGKGLTVDFGKWASSLGIEGNYSKDQVNYSRSFYFDFMPL
jgi:hypothetical protein